MTAADPAALLELATDLARRAGALALSMREGVEQESTKSSPTDVVTVRVPLEFVGLTREQEKEGSFKILLRSLQVKAVVSKLPASMTVQVGNLKLDESAHIADLEVPEGITVMAVRSLALASLVKL